jgi:hypothetical protein
MESTGGDRKAQQLHPTKHCASGSEDSAQRRTVNMANDRSLSQRWQEYRPSKAALFWSCLGCVVLTLLIGFTWGGWVTGGTATERADKAAAQARAELAATVCVEQFLNASDARAQLASLKKTMSWQRDDFVEKGGWATPPGLDKPVTSAAELCAERLATTELPPSDQGARSGTQSKTIGTAAQ